MKNIAVIIPTFNERNGIIRAIKQIKSQVPSASIFIVDDNSPDHTADLVRKTFARDKKVTVLVRKEKGGRGSAVLFGFKEALKSEKLSYYIEMDADLCHDPKYIKALIEKCQSADVVVASRYLPLSHATGWSFKRRFMSRLINIYAKTLLQIPITDYTDGFRCYSRRAVEFLSKQKFQSKGYIVLSEAAYLCYKNGFVIKEMPFTIHFKSISKSNLNIMEIREALLTIFRLRFSK